MAKTVFRICLLLFSIFLSSLVFGHAESLHIKEAVTPQGAWPWEKTKFKCPSLNGVFSNPDDCSSFFLCVAGISSKRSCRPFTIFDKYHKKCLSAFIAICDKGDDSTTESTKSTKSKITTTTKETTKDTFTCPSVFGTFMHPTDCTKYYICALYIPSLRNCPERDLFDGLKKQCKNAKDVDCGSRIKPTESTVLTTEPITATEPIITTTEAEPETTPEVTTTSEAPKPTGPPETDCDENDLDCIIDDTGVTPDWFTCPEDIGSYPHPSSQKLFIFCLNWIPSVKKCGQDLIYSDELRTCVDP